MFHIELDTLFNLIYNLVYVPGTIIVLVVNRLFAYKYRTSRLQRLFYTASMIVFGFIGSHFGAALYNWFQSMRGRPGGNNRTVFGTIITVFFETLIFVMIEKGIRALIRKTKNKPVPDVSLLDVYDMLQPGAFILVLFTKFRCLWVGCCFGIPWSWGFHSKYLNTTVFPVQIVEAVLTFFVLVAVYCITQTRFFRRGMALLLGGGLFSVERFFLEYLMYYEPEDRKYLGFFTFYQCLCMLIFVVCVAIVTLLYKTRPSDPLPGKLRPVFEAREQQRAKRPRKQTVSQKKYGKEWQSTKKKYKKKKH